MQRKKGHETRIENLLDNKWEEGNKFNAKPKKSKERSDASP